MEKSNHKNSLKMDKISAFRSGSSVMIRFGSTSRTLSHQTEEEAKETFRQIMAVKADPTQENRDRLMEIIDPDYRIPQNEYLERDRYGNFFLGKVRMAIPQLLKDKVLEYVEDGIELTPLVNFWRLLALNPDAHVRKSLYNFASHFGFPITDMGYFIAYKSVYFAGKKHESIGLSVVSSYVYLRAEGKNPADYNVYSIKEGAKKQYTVVHKDDVEEFLKDFVQEEEEMVSLKELLSMTQEERDALHYEEERDVYYRINEVVDIVPQPLGTLEEAFRNIPALFDGEDENSFTDCHTRSMDIRIGTPVKMPREDCDNDPSRTCSRGLHVGTPQYVKDFGNSSRHILACLVNPMNVVAVPDEYDGQKMRCCEYLPYAVCEVNEDGSLREIDTKYFEEDYVGYEVKELEKMLEEKLGNPDVSESEIQEIRNRLIQIS